MVTWDTWDMQKTGPNTRGCAFQLTHIIVCALGAVLAF